MKIELEKINHILIRELASCGAFVGYCVETCADDTRIQVQVYYDEQIPPGQRPSLGLDEFHGALSINVTDTPVFRAPLGLALPTAIQGLQAGSAVQVFAKFRGQDVRSKQGSIGAFVQSILGGTWLITSNHVLSANGFFKNLDSDEDDGVFVEKINSSVSKVVKYVSIAARNKVDVAAARLQEIVPKPGPLYDPPLHHGQPWDPPTGTLVRVYGHSGAHLGVVKCNRFHCVVKEPFTPTRAVYLDQLLLEGHAPNFVQDGDSGSLVTGFDQEDGCWRPIGLVMASQNFDHRLVVACPLSACLTALSSQIGDPTEILTDWPSAS